MNNLKALEKWYNENYWAMLVGHNGYFIARNEDGKSLQFSSHEWDINETYQFSVNGIDQMEQEQRLNKVAIIPFYKSVHDFYKTENM